MRFLEGSSKLSGKREITRNLILSGLGEGSDSPEEFCKRNEWKMIEKV
jgi:hypothetical protein